MRTLLPAILFLLLKPASAQERDLAYASPQATQVFLAAPAVRTSPIPADKPHPSALDLRALKTEGKPARKILGYSKKETPIEAWYFPGTSQKNALIIGGVHGSELSAIDVANDVIRQLQNGTKPYYSVIVVPTLFPDNAETAAACKDDRHETNQGRYSGKNAVDPNRQMPTLGKAFRAAQPVDAYGREIEKENTLLLQLIQDFAPSRIVNLHGIKTYAKAGVYADPRTDCNGRALGFQSDSALALLMAGHIANNGGNVPGNGLKTAPTALYYLDPKPAAKGQIQPRNLQGTNSNGKIAGVSLGSWASTAVCDRATGYSRPALRILTVEFPGYKKPAEYTSPLDRDWFARQVVLYAEAIYQYFLQDYCAEDADTDAKAAAPVALGKQP